jgi:hypothetical protein
MDRVQSRIEVLRVWGRSNDPNRVALIENAINEYLKGEPGILRLSLERALRRDRARRGCEAPRRGLEHSEGLCSLAAPSAGVGCSFMRPRTVPDNAKTQCHEDANG